VPDIAAFTVHVHLGNLHFAHTVHVCVYIIVSLKWIVFVNSIKWLVLVIEMLCFCKVATEVFNVAVL
jgi:hypothetical protein